MPALPNVTSECAQFFHRVLTCRCSQTTDCFSPNDSRIVLLPDKDIEKSDIHALLYIVVTLLFYSLGIIVGIVTYLKKERAEIEESQSFEQFLLDYSNRSKAHKVQQVIARLNVLNEQKEKTKKIVKLKSENNHSKMASNDSRSCDNPSSDDKDPLPEVEPGNEEEDPEEPLSTIVAKLMNTDSTCDPHCTDVIERGNLEKAPSVQSIRDYTEEPKRSARNSIASNDDDNDNDNRDNEKSNLLLQQPSGTAIDLEYETFTPDISIHKGCIVTNV